MYIESFRQAHIYPCLYTVFQESIVHIPKCGHHGTAVACIWHLQSILRTRRAVAQDWARHYGDSGYTKTGMTFFRLSDLAFFSGCSLDFNSLVHAFCMFHAGAYSKIY